MIRTEFALRYNERTHEALSRAAAETQGLKKRLITPMDNRTAMDSILIAQKPGNIVRPVNEPFDDPQRGRTFLYPPNRPNDRSRIVMWMDGWGDGPDRDQGRAADLARERRREEAAMKRGDRIRPRRSRASRQETSPGAGPGSVAPERRWLKISGRSEARKWALRHFSRDALTREEFDALSAWRTGDMYRILNARVRAQTERIPAEYRTEARMAQLDRLIQHLDDAVHKFSLPEDMVLYRGFTDPRLIKYWQTLESENYNDSGFLATSILPSPAFLYAAKSGKSSDAIIATIRAPGGTPGVSIEAIFPMSKTARREQEILLPPNTLFVINRVWIDGRGLRRLDLNVM